MIRGRQAESRPVRDWNDYAAELWSALVEPLLPPATGPAEQTVVTEDPMEGTFRG